MKREDLIERSKVEWQMASGPARSPVTFYCSRELLDEMDDKVFEQAGKVAQLPGLVGGVHVMPDAHWGYGFPIGGVAAFDAGEGGVVSAGGVGFDISCGVRLLLTGLQARDIEEIKYALADALFQAIPAGVGSHGALVLGPEQMDAMLQGGAQWAVAQGFGRTEDLSRIEEQGRMTGAAPEQVSDNAKHRQRKEMGTLGSGNHYLEVQRIEEILDEAIAAVFGLRVGEVVVSIHCGSRGLGHQIGTDYLREMVLAAREAGFALPDRELACAPITSPLGQRYLGAMRAGINCALANRQILTHLARGVFAQFLPGIQMPLLYDVSHNTCKEETHRVNERERRVFVHRKGATRALPPWHADLPACFQTSGQPVLIGGSMGTASYVLAGAAGAERAWYSACHGAGRAMSRHEALRHWSGRAVIDELRAKGILIRSPSARGVAEEAPLAYKDVSKVVAAAEQAGLVKNVARLSPMICVKG
jgi:tRNA-splicing ligase RtcB